MGAARVTRLLATGDSVTDCDRARPVGGPAPDTLGTGYVRILRELLAPGRPGLEVLNTGTGGDTVRHLAARWRRDVLDLRPHWLTVCIGINDVWRAFDTPGDPAAAVPLDEYGRVYDRLLAEIRPGLRGLVLVSPFFVTEDRAHPMRRRMDECGQAARRVAARHGALWLDAQALFDAACRVATPPSLAPDRVHPSPAGHALLAQALAALLAPQLPTSGGRCP